MLEASNIGECKMGELRGEGENWYQASCLDSCFLLCVCVCVFFEEEKALVWTEHAFVAGV